MQTSKQQLVVHIKPNLLLQLVEQPTNFHSTLKTFKNLLKTEIFFFLCSKKPHKKTLFTTLTLFFKIVIAVAITAANT